MLICIVINRENDFSSIILLANNLFFFLAIYFLESVLNNNLQYLHKMNTPTKKKNEINLIFFLAFTTHKYKNET